MPATSLLESRLLHRLEGMTLVSRQRLANQGQGDRRSRLRGQSLQVVDFRSYAPGDDVRQVDWNFYGRSGELFVRLYEDEQVLTVHLLIDVSRSMDWGTPNKRQTSLALASALAYIVLGSYDRLAIGFLADQVIGQAGPFWGRHQAAAAFAALAAAPTASQTDSAASIASYLSRLRRPGLILFLSDLLSPSAATGLRRLTAAGHEATVIHLLAPQEIDPEPAEDVRLIDRETNQSVEVHLDSETIARYRQRVAAWSEELAQICRERNARYLRLSTDQDLERGMIRAMRAQGILS
ncbi:MAG TPA: DUF58 domain-containing protein [Chloroflexota bacterium]|jgi:uncharacterized protein (DUF58 family)|nr:DUF58 domain-containing protein [Chloroflexota bacterium]